MNKEDKRLSINDLTIDDYLKSFKYAIDENDWYEIEGKFLKPLYEQIINLQQENKQLKERVEYLERSNNRREDEIISLRDEQELDKLKEELNKKNKIIEEIKEYCKSYRCWEDEDGTWQESDFCIDDLLEIIEKGSES